MCTAPMHRHALNRMTKVAQRSTIHHDLVATSISGMIASVSAEILPYAKCCWDFDWEPTTCFAVVEKVASVKIS